MMLWVMMTFLVSLNCQSLTSQLASSWRVGSHCCLLTVCRAEILAETDQSQQRVARSVPAPESVINFLPIKSADYESDRYSESQAPSDRDTLLGSWQRQPQLPVRLSQSQKNPPWSLQPQVGKRGKRYRERAGGQSSYYRQQDSPQLDMLSHSLEAVEEGAATTMLARQQRNGRRYDVPQIECPRSPDHMERFACPRPDRRGRFRCIDDRALCDGFYDCPDKEDENPDHCLFYKTTKAHLDILAEALLRWARGR